MKTILKLLVVAIVLHGAYRVGSAFWTFYRFEDGLQELAQFGGSRSTADLHQQAVRISSDLRVPVTPGAIKITKTDREIRIEAVYTDQLQVLPNYFYPWVFRPSVKAWTRAW